MKNCSCGSASGGTRRYKKRFFKKKQSRSRSRSRSNRLRGGSFKIDPTITSLTGMNMYPFNGYAGGNHDPSAPSNTFSTRFE